MTIGTLLHPTLSTYAEKVDRLENSSLWKFMAAPGWRLSWNFETDRPSDEARMPDIEYLEAYVLNLRFFIQDNEPTSLRNLASLYERECRDQHLLARFRQVRDTINSELDRSIWFKFNDQTVTYRVIFNGMIYSRFAHSERNQHALFQQMSDHPFGYMLAMDSFLRCIDLVHRGLVLVRDLNTCAFGSQPAL